MPESDGLAQLPDAFEKQPEDPTGNQEEDGEVIRRPRMPVRGFASFSGEYVSFRRERRVGREPILKSQLSVVEKYRPHQED